ncbi:Uncharacterised protein [Yersinia kristensenii]|nr:Uncharacterised protein [Yersinia kristensenii]
MPSISGGRGRMVPLSIYPKSLELPVGSQRAHPDELTHVSDSGK